LSGVRSRRRHGREKLELRGGIRPWGAAAHGAQVRPAAVSVRAPEALALARASHALALPPLPPDRRGAAQAAPVGDRSRKKVTRPTSARYGRCASTGCLRPSPPDARTAAPCG